MTKRLLGNRPCQTYILLLVVLVLGQLTVLYHKKVLRLSSTALFSLSPKKTADPGKDARGLTDMIQQEIKESEEKNTFLSVSSRQGTKLRRTPVQSLPPKVQPLKVLYWQPTDNHRFYFPERYRKTLVCPDTGVQFVTLKAKSSEEQRKALQKADVVIFTYDFAEELFVPRKSRKDTIFVLASLESPHVRKVEFLHSQAFLKHFNFFWSYSSRNIFSTTTLTRRKHSLTLSDILQSPLVKFPDKVSSALMVTIVSNCADKAGRFLLMNELAKHNIPMHHYGHCMKNKELPTWAGGKHGQKNRRLGVLAAKYKFVLSVENILCSGYVSEKLIKGFVGGSINVVTSVRNGSVPDYAPFLPSLSLPIVFNTAQFATAKRVAERMQEIGSSEQLYGEYMEYRKLTVDQLNPVFRQNMERKRVNSAFCRFARHYFNSESRTLNRSSARDCKAFANETCAVYQADGKLTFKDY